MEFTELQDSWLKHEPIGGVAFLLNDTVRMLSGPHEGKAGSVIALLNLAPEPIFLVKLDSGGDVRCPQSTLRSSMAETAAQALAELQLWYARHCDGDWEHGRGIDIGTLDNPGWRVRINLADTELEGIPFPEVSHLEPAREWLHCQVKDLHFEGAGGPHMLGEILRVFLDWADSTTIRTG